MVPIWVKINSQVTVTLVNSTLTTTSARTFLSVHAGTEPILHAAKYSGTQSPDTFLLLNGLLHHVTEGQGEHTHVQFVKSWTAFLIHVKKSSLILTKYYLR